MYADSNFTDSELKHVLNNLCEKAVIELELMYASEYKYFIFDQIKKLNTEYRTMIRLKSGEPVGIFGRLPISDKVYGIFFLTTDRLHFGNIIKLIRETKKYIKEWEKSSKLIMDYCYKKNTQIIKWLLLLGFKPAEVKIEQNFQIYYKGDINEYIK